MQEPILSPGRATQGSSDFPPYSSLFAGFVSALLYIIDWYIIPEGSSNPLINVHRINLGALAVQSVLVILIFLVCSFFAPFIEQNMMVWWSINIWRNKQSNADNHNFTNDVDVPDRNVSSAWLLLCRLTGVVGTIILIGGGLEWKIKGIAPQTIEVDLLFICLLILGWPRILPWFSFTHIWLEYGSDTSLADLSTFQNSNHTPGNTQKKAQRVHSTREMF